MRQHLITRQGATITFPVRNEIEAAITCTYLMGTASPSSPRCVFLQKLALPTLHCHLTMSTHALNTIGDNATARVPPSLFGINFYDSTLASFRSIPFSQLVPPGRRPYYTYARGISSHKTSVRSDSRNCHHMSLCPLVGIRFVVGKYIFIIDLSVPRTSSRRVVFVVRLRGESPLTSMKSTLNPLVLCAVLVVKTGGTFV